MRGIIIRAIGQWAIGALSCVMMYGGRRSEVLIGGVAGFVWNIVIGMRGGGLWGGAPHLPG